MNILFVSACLIYSMLASADAVNARDAKLISHAKHVSVAKLDAALPEVSFEQWLRTEAGADTRLEWEVNDCGEQTGSPGQNAAEIPTCVEADAWLKDGREIVVMVAVSESKRAAKARLTQSFAVYFAQLITPRERITIKQLSDLPAALARTHEGQQNPETAK